MVETPNHTFTDMYPQIQESTIQFKIIISVIQLYNKKNNQKQRHCMNKNAGRCKISKTDISSHFENPLKMCFGN